MIFTEEFLYFIWQFRRYGNQKIYTEAGEEIKVIHQGLLNKNAGPDFTNAKLLIADTIWVGNIEIHINASDWHLHQHQLDDAYENVILHVVYHYDCDIYHRDGSIVPVFVLKDLFPVDLLSNYEQLINNFNDFPCAQQIAQVDQFLIDSLLASTAIERLIEKSKEVNEKLLIHKNDWETVFYQFLAKSFGFKVNAIPMEMLAQSLPIHLFAKHKNQPLQIEALIFGQAGFLKQKFADDYPKQLRREYLFLKKKYGLKAIDVALWKFMRMRPQNFPTLKLAQLAAMIVNCNHLFSKVIDAETVLDYQQLFENLPVHPFWENHYHFNKNAKQVSLQLGKETINSILINTIAIMLFSYGKNIDQYDMLKKAIDLLEKLPPEKNAILKQYKIAGVKVKNAFYSQGLLQLRNKYCHTKQCLNCTIGVKILKR